MVSIYKNEDPHRNCWAGNNKMVGFPFLITMHMNLCLVKISAIRMCEFPNFIYFGLLVFLYKVC